MKLQTLLLALMIFMISQEVKSQSHGCGTPPLDGATREYIIKEIVNKENDYALAENAPTCLPVKLHIVRTDAGNNGFNVNDIGEAFANLSAGFKDIGIDFYVCGGINYIDNSDFYNFNTSAPDSDVETDFTAGEIVTDAINFFIVNSINLQNFGPAAGYAAFPSSSINSNKIVMDLSYMTSSPTATLTHELGHYFGLPHTHSLTQGGPNGPFAERVVRTGPNANCETNGDMLCDTDADPRFDQSTFDYTTCTYTGTATDDLGVTYNPVTAISNIMSYYPDLCTEGFSAGQLTRMNAGLVTRMGYSTYDYSCTPDVVNPPTITGITFNVSGVAKINWTDNANNELGYIIERSYVSSTTGFVAYVGTPPNTTIASDSESFFSPNTPAWYRIRAANSPCEYSNVVFNGVDGGNCEENLNGYEYLGEWNDTKYFISDEETTWAQAKINAIPLGAELAAINSEAENNQISNWVDEIVFIGLTDENNEGTPTWDNGDPFTFNNIEDQNTADDDYVRRIAWNGKWQWVNQYAKHYNLIEVPCDDGGCTCPPTNQPVCGSDGVTYPNGCEAECAGIFNYTDGACTTGGGCPNAIAGFTTLGEFGNSKYYLSNGTSRPVDAQAAAESEGGYLVTINNASENNFIQQNISEMVYIGLNDYDSEGNLEWFNGESFSYNNIDPCGFCNENSGNQDFVIMAPWNGTWSFSNFYNSRKYVMEIPCDGGGGGNDLPDLTLSNLENVAGNMTQGAVEFFEFDLQNIGNATATNSYTITMYISSDQNLSGNDIDAGEIQTANTFVGTDANVPAAITVPNVPDGIYYMIIKVDSENTVQESNENNNIITSGQITIGSGGGGGCNGSTGISGFAYIGEYGNSRYYFSNNKSRPTDAQATCQSNGGYLASISSSGENNFIKQGISGFAYIGLNDEDSEGNLEWYSGQNVNYTNFDICGSCNGNSGNQDYGVMAGWSGGWSWSNFWNQRKYVMEIPCNANSNNTLITISDLEKDALEFMAIVPNPANQFVGVQLKSNEAMDIDIQIFDSRGVLVHSQQSTLFEGLNGLEMNISNLAAGMYWINIPQAQRNQSVRKFVKIRD